VSSFVGDVVMPLLGKLIGGVNFKDLAISLGNDPAGAPVLLKYGSFLQSAFDFLIIAAAIFMALKAINKLKAPPPAVPAAPPADVALLTEIRDLLKK
jgi:large conductance mechanosensitive channel